MEKRPSIPQQIPVFLGFFVMGFVDVVGIATNYAKKDLGLRDSVANLLPLTVFIWFALFSVPIGMWMNRIGRRKTVGLGLALTAVAMLIPLAVYRFNTLLITFRLLKDPFITQLLIGVIAVVGIDVGLNTTLPKFLMARTSLPLEKAGLGTSLYFIARTTGSLAGVVLLTRLKSRFFLKLSATTGLASLATLLLTSQLALILPLIFLLGFALSNIFPILFAAALHRAPGHQNEVSGLLIMGVSGGAILLPIMGLLGDTGGPTAALAFLLLAWAYLAWTGRKLR